MAERNICLSVLKEKADKLFILCIKVKEINFAKTCKMCCYELKITKKICGPIHIRKLSAATC